MKIEAHPKIALPNDVDCKCIDLCNLLNRLPGLYTYESCQGHGKHPYWIFFKCDNIDTLSRLGRTVSLNYSDNNWEIVLDSTDTHPRGCFWLRTKMILPINVLDNSIKNLMEHILYWFDDKFDEHFEESRKIKNDA
jgi:hypothetical protein